MRSFRRLLLLFLLLPALIFVTGCADTGNSASSGSSSGSGEGGDGDSEGDEEEVVRDDFYEVLEKRQNGGQLVPGDEVSSFDGKPRMERTPLVSMIIVEGNNTGDKSAYLLPPRDYNRVGVGNRLLESTLARWESTDLDHVPPPPPPPESALRSRTGGVAENYVY